MTRPAYFVGGMLALLLVLVKGAFVLSLGDVFFYGEELEKATAAKAMIDGLDVPHHQLAYHYYEGGGFVISHLVALAFMVVGQNLLALKLVALGFQLALLGMGCWFTRRLFGSPAALFFGLLFIFAPASYQKISLLALGVHFEACIFLLAVLLLGRRVLFEAKATGVHWFLLGVVTGVGIYFSYLVAVSALWVAMLILVFRRRELLGRMGLYTALGTALGLTPLIAMYSLVGNEVFDIHGVGLLSWGGGWGNLVLFGEAMSSIFYTEVGALHLSAWLRLGCFLAALVVLLRRANATSSWGAKAKPTSLYVLGFMALLLGIYLYSSFVDGRVTHHFLMSRLVAFWLFGTVLVAAGIGRLWQSELLSQRVLAGLAGAVLVCVGVGNSAQVIQTGQPLHLGLNWEILTRHKGYSYLQYFEKIMPHLDGDDVAKLQWVEGFDEVDHGPVRAAAAGAIFGHSFELGKKGQSGHAVDTVQDTLGRAAGLDRQCLLDYELGLGALFVRAQEWDRIEALRWAESLSLAQRASRLTALGRFGWNRNSMEAVLRETMGHTKGTLGVEEYYRGLGRWAYTQRRLNPAGFEVEVHLLPEDVRRLLCEGFELERSWNTLPDYAARSSLFLGEVLAADAVTAP